MRLVNFRSPALAKASSRRWPPCSPGEKCAAGATERSQFPRCLFPAPASLYIRGERTMPGAAAAVYTDLAVFTGRAHPLLAEAICARLGRPLGRIDVFEFSNENIFVQFQENIRQRDVYLVQPFVSPVNTSILELLIMIDAARRASAGRITAVIPYYAYGRSDKKDQPRVPITARLVADMISVAGADRLLTMDLHQGQIQGFFSIPVDELTAVHMVSNYFKRLNLEDLVVVTDLGFAKRARLFAEILEAPLAVIEKRRPGAGAAPSELGKAELLNVIGEVKGRRAIIVDDEIDTASTLMEIERALIREGVTEIYACATHGILSDPAIDRLRRSDITEVVITDTVPLPAAKRLHQIKVLSVAPLIGEAIKRIHRGESVGALFSGDLDLVQEMLLWDEATENDAA